MASSDPAGLRASAANGTTPPRLLVIDRDRRIPGERLAEAIGLNSSARIYPGPLSNGGVELIEQQDHIQFLEGGIEEDLAPIGHDKSERYDSSVVALKPGHLRIEQRPLDRSCQVARKSPSRVPTE